MSFNKKFISKSPIANNGDPLKTGSFSDVAANTKAFSTMSDILPKKNITPPQKSTYGFGTSTNASWDKPKKPSNEQKAKSLEMQKKMLEIRQSKAGTKVLDDVQDKLETAGMMLGVGVVPDVINTGISAARGLSAKFSGDKKAQLEAAKNMGIHMASAMPIGGFFTAGGNKLKKMTSKVSTFNKSKVDEYGINRNFRKSTDPSEFGGTKQPWESHSNELKKVGEFSKNLDEFKTANPSWNTSKKNFKYLGTRSGRDMIEINTPVGNQTFYRSTGLGGKAGSKGAWVPFQGYKNINTNKGLRKDWFMKEGTEANFLGNKMSTINLDKSHPRALKGESTISVRQQLKEMGVNPLEEIRKGNLKLTKPGYDFNYSSNPLGSINKIAKGLKSIEKGIVYGPLPR